jgi:alpha-tubulin suppressor-like RCC1 family protein
MQMACNTPPAAVCATVTTLRTYLAAGTCGGGTCSYSFTDSTCVTGCNGGACAPPPETFVSVGGYHTCALVTGVVKCFGYNANGQLGTSTTTNSAVPVDMVGVSPDVLAVAAGSSHTCIMTSAGALKCMGSNKWGALGNGSTTDSLIPVDVVGLSSGVVAVSAGGYHTCALTSAGAVKCWGKNADGELGDDSTTDSLIPVDVVGLSSGVVAISGGTYHTCAITSAGAVKCWGRNDHGQLGNNSTTKSLVPVDVTGLSSGVSAVTAGYNHTCAVTSSGAAKCWGKDDVGQLGDGTTTQSLVPVGVTGLSSGVFAISAGANHVCAVVSPGAAKCWGRNSEGELGNGSSNESHVPVGVSGLSSGVVAVSASNGNHTCVVTSSNGVKCWGQNFYGELGNNTVAIDSHLPVDVVGL